MRSDLDAIQAAARQSNYFYEQAKFLCNRIGPRLSGSPQAEAAVQYVTEQMRALGLAVRLEPVTVSHWVRGKEEAVLTSYPGQVPKTSQRIVLAALGNSGPTPADGITAAVVVVSTFEELDTVPEEGVRGNIVLFDYHFDDFAAKAGRWDQAYRCAAPYRNDGPAPAAQKGAVAA